ncbi:MAG: hypothetical protein R2847_12575 [Bacteroidia bacterium]
MATHPEQNVSHYFSDVGEFKVKLIVENISGCVDSAEQTIVVNPFWCPMHLLLTVTDATKYSSDPGFNMDYSGFKLRTGPTRNAVSNRFTGKLWDGSDGHGRHCTSGNPSVYSLVCNN